VTEVRVPLSNPLFRGERRLRIALVGLPGGGKTTLFEAVSSTAPRSGELRGAHGVYRECTVQIGFDEASVVDLPGIHSLHHLEGDDLLALKYLLWGNERPAVSQHEGAGPPVPFAPPDLIIQVVDAGNLQSHLELTLELSQLGRPIVLALNRMDEATRKGLYVNARALEELLGMAVVPTVALTPPVDGAQLLEFFTVNRNPLQDKNQQILKIGGFLRFAANSLDGAAGVLGGFLALKTEHAHRFPPIRLG